LRSETDKTKEKTVMQWTTPTFEEISLNCEINSYGSAQM